MHAPGALELEQHFQGTHITIQYKQHTASTTRDLPVTIHRDLSWHTQCERKIRRRP